MRAGWQSPQLRGLGAVGEDSVPSSLLLLVAPGFLWTSPHQITGHSEDLFLQNARVFVTQVEGQRCLPGSQA